MMVAAAVPLEVTVIDFVTAVPTATLPNASDVVLRLMTDVAALSCRAKLREEEFALAVIVAVWDVLTAATFAANEAADAPAATVTLPGTVTAVLLLRKVTPTPPAGAAELSETVQFVVPEPAKELPSQESALTEGTPTVDPEEPPNLIVVDFDTAPWLAVSDTVCDVVTADTCATKFAVVAPEGTVTDEGTAIALLLLDNVATKPLLGAAEVSVTVQVS